MEREKKAKRLTIERGCALESHQRVSIGDVASEVSATDIRRRANRGQSIHGLVAARVEEYILKQGLYR